MTDSFKIDNIYEESLNFAHIWSFYAWLHAGVYAGNMNKCVSTNLRIADEWKKSFFLN